MALLKSCNGNSPQFGSDCWLAENATIVGDVITGDELCFHYTGSFIFSKFNLYLLSFNLVDEPLNFNNLL
jgi:hypothetical protein